MLLLAAARRRPETDATAALVTEIFTGLPLRTLPQSVSDALESLRPVPARRRFEPSAGVPEADPGHPSSQVVPAR